MGMDIAGLLRRNQAEIDVGTTVLGGLLDFGGSISGGIDSMNEGKFKAAVLRNNALIMEDNARAAIEAGQTAAGEKAIETAQTIGAQRAGLAAHGIVVDQDTALQLNLDTARIGKLDQLTIMKNAERQALALRMQGAQLRAQAKASRTGFLGAAFGGFGSLLSTAGKVASKWMTYKEEEGLGS